MNTTKLFAIAALVVCSLSSCYRHNMKACFTADRQSALVGDSITFTDCANYDGRTQAAGWDFGDGVRSTTANADPVRHAYAKAGAYAVSMSIGGAEIGNTTTDSITIR